MRAKYRLSFDVTFESCDRLPTDEELKDVFVDFNGPECLVVTRDKVSATKIADSCAKEPL